MTTMSDLSRGALALGLALTLVGAGPAGAQEVDARWLPWIGCWEPANGSADVDLVCVRPGDAGAVEIVRVKGTEVVGTEVVRTDGTRHESAHESCKGWEEGAFSRDGQRLFLSSSFTCEEGVTQEAGAVFAMTYPPEWLDVRVAGMGGEHVAFVQRFTPADRALAEAAGFGDLARALRPGTLGARLAATAPLDVDDVIEASAQVPEEAVRAFLAEQGNPLELSAAELVRMADAGVSEKVIDVAVAVSYPDRFTLRGGGEQVARTALDEGSLRRRWAYGGSMGIVHGFYDPLFAPWSLRYDYGYGSGYYGYGYNPYSYGWGYGGGYYGGGYYGGYTPVVVDVDRTPVEHGRVIAGRGYSRGGSGSSATPGRSSGGASQSPSLFPSGSSGGSSSSGGGSSTGRTAKPRGGGGGS